MTTREANTRRPKKERAVRPTQAHQGHSDAGIPPPAIQQLSQDTSLPLTAQDRTLCLLADRVRSRSTSLFRAPSQKTCGLKQNGSTDNSHKESDPSNGEVPASAARRFAAPASSPHSGFFLRRITTSWSKTGRPEKRDKSELLRPPQSTIFRRCATSALPKPERARH